LRLQNEEDSGEQDKKQFRVISRRKATHSAKRPTPTRRFADTPTRFSPDPPTRFPSVPSVRDNTKMPLVSLSVEEELPIPLKAHADPPTRRTADPFLPRPADTLLPSCQFPSARCTLPNPKKFASAVLA
jgi:hypothetical protein